MSAEKFESILKLQTADEIKRARAHYVIDTSLGLDHARERVAYILEDLRRRDARVWRQRKASAQNQA
jgi:dephospho-CoA kinase